MEDVLDLYEEEYDGRYPVICFDEKPFQMLGDTRVSIPAQKGRIKRVDYEYKREGTCNLFVFLEPLKGWRHVKVTERRTKHDFAACMKELVDEHFPEAERIRLVMDNLNTHTMGALYEVYPPEEARRIIRKIEVHYTPKHGSWLNMAEIEISALSRECLGRRIPSQELLQKETNACIKRRNDKKTTVGWGFFSKDARIKMKHLYV
jgi:transposase